MKAEHHSVMSGTAMAVLLGVVIFLGCWFLPIGFGYKLLLFIVGIVIFILGLKHSKG